jgi:hypothetical protein
MRFRRLESWNGSEGVERWNGVVERWNGVVEGWNGAEGVEGVEGVECLGGLVFIFYWKLVCYFCKLSLFESKC